ncbi:phosphatidylglycerophosphatase A [Variovorax dokdonensis]|uniref:Phosphatidylglycerophosphatase A n=1 Tax=Variovorax dokdonensis TaxID=344883 RepID=A0ABT7NAC8_9BURK|nr:phosphatidylglycerophosphatase A [Variovorax dokdonensis]MDM0044895.1 phosphatidylglycerophosphatase A [Variovorax dokdonensis]
MPADTPSTTPPPSASFPDSPDSSSRASAASAAPARPTVKFLFAHPAHFIALGAGSGLARRAPGTVGTLWAWAAFLVMQSWLPPATIGWIILAGLPIGWWACTVTARHMGIADPGSIVWDEVVAFWIVLWLVLPAGLLAQVIAFALFRYFDAAKPGPVRWADQLFKQRSAAPQATRWRAAGFGILLDDLVAAFCTLLVIALWRAFVSS